MKGLIGVYNSHKAALSALKELERSGFSTKQLSIMGKAHLENNHIHVKSNDKVERAEISISLIAGTTLGLLTGMGIFAIPGVGILYGAGAFVGAIAGLEAGLFTGGLTAIITSAVGVDTAIAANYEKHLNEGNFLVFVQGNEKEINNARHVLHTQGYSVELNLN
jgi:hypothetical protein